MANESDDVLDVTGMPSGSLVLYATNIAQLLLGIVICVANSFLLGAIVCRQRLKNPANMLLGNLCFANLIVGMMLCVVNVMDGWTAVGLLKTETSLIIINSYINIASLLALLTARYVAIRSPHCQGMSIPSCAKILVSMWAVVMVLLLVKAMVFGFHQMGYNACFTCYQVFEVVTLVIFTLSTVFTFAICALKVISHRSRTVHDQSQPTPLDYSLHYRAVLSIGLLLFVFVSCFVLFVVMYIVWLGSGTLAKDADEIIITLFFLHCVINPTLCCVREKELGQSVKRLLFCHQGGTTREPEPPVVPMDPAQPPPPRRSIAGSPRPWATQGAAPSAPSAPNPQQSTPPPSSGLPHIVQPAAIAQNSEQKPATQLGKNGAVIFSDLPSVSSVGQLSTARGSRPGTPLPPISPRVNRSVIPASNNRLNSIDEENSSPLDPREELLKDDPIFMEQLKKKMNADWPLGMNDQAVLSDPHDQLTSV